MASQAPAGSQELEHMSCEDFGEFKEALRTMRLIDDKIIYNLNVSVPTASFKHEVNAEEKCQNLYKELLSAYQGRDKAIKDCIVKISDEVKELKKQKEANSNDTEVVRRLRKQQTTLRLMQAELSVEEVVKLRSMKAFTEKCWKVYKPPKAT